MFFTQNKVLTALLSFFALALQIQVTLFAKDDYQGLRINLGDLTLPFIAVFILLSLILKKSSWPRWQRPFHILWPVALSAVMALALLNFYRLNDELSHWALVNKFIGWFVLMGYLGLGGWISTNTRLLDLKKFIRPLVCGFLLISAASCVMIFIHGYDLLPEKLLILIPPYSQLEALMGNRNAFAFLLVTLSIFTTLFSYKAPEILPRRLLILFWLLFPVFLFLNASRALWIATGPLMCYFIFLTRKDSLRLIILPFCLGGLLFFTLVPDSLRNVAQDPLARSELLYENNADEKNIHAGDSLRFKILNTALKTWQEHPVLGAGLGGGMRGQEIEYGQTLAVIDNSALWILTDMGLFGLSLFLGSFVAMLIALWRGTRTRAPDKALLMHCAFIMLLVFGVFSLVHELLYTRFIWFILGLSLAGPALKNQEVNQN